MSLRPGTTSPAEDPPVSRAGHVLVSSPRIGIVAATPGQTLSVYVGGGGSDGGAWGYGNGGRGGKYAGLGYDGGGGGGGSAVLAGGTFLIVAGGGANWTFDLARYGGAGGDRGYPAQNGKDGQCGSIGPPPPPPAAPTECGAGGGGTFIGPDAGGGGGAANSRRAMPAKA